MSTEKELIAGLVGMALADALSQMKIPGADLQTALTVNLTSAIHDIIERLVESSRAGMTLADAVKAWAKDDADVWEPLHCDPPACRQCQMVAQAKAVYTAQGVPFA